MIELFRNHILIIDDSPDSRILLRALLEAKGYTSDTTSNGEEALAFLMLTKKLPELILVDLRMPVMDGLTFRTHQLEKLRIKHIPVIFMSGDENLSSVRKETNSHVLPKPLDLKLLIRTMENVLHATSS